MHLDGWFQLIPNLLKCLEIICLNTLFVIVVDIHGHCGSIICVVNHCEKRKMAIRSDDTGTSPVCKTINKTAKWKYYCDNTDCKKADCAKLTRRKIEDDCTDEKEANITSDRQQDDEATERY